MTPIVGDAIEVRIDECMDSGVVQHWLPATVVRATMDTIVASFMNPEREGGIVETCAMSKEQDIGRIWRWPS